MDFKVYLKEQLSMHASTQPQDIVKQCYQAAFGAEHLIDDVSAARDYFLKEYAITPKSQLPLFENISSEICRVNLAAWKRCNLPEDWLFRMFLLTAKKTQDGSDKFLQYLLAADRCIRSINDEFTYFEWEKYLAEYKSGGVRAVHHSNFYREQESPAYRIVRRSIVNLLPILQELASVKQVNTPFVIALDGRAASGKTTAAEALSFILSGSVIHMDDFFLSANMRTEKRLSTPGGNVHYERFSDEVLPQLKQEKNFSYRIFDCEQMNYAGIREIAASPYYIIEGSYSCHPAFGDYTCITVFMDVDCKEQLARIARRNSAEIAERFRTEWIPMEENYFRAYHIKENAKITIGT